MFIAAATIDAGTLVAQLGAHTFAVASSPYQLVGGPVPELARVLREGGRPDIARRLLSRQQANFQEGQRELQALIARAPDSPLTHAVSQVLYAYERKARELALPDTAGRPIFPFSLAGYADFLMASPRIVAEDLLYPAQEWLFHPSFSEEAIYHLFSGVTFKEIGRGTQAVVYACGGYVVKELYGCIMMRDGDRRAIHGHPILGRTLRAMNQIAGETTLWRFTKKQLRLMVNRFREQQVVSAVSNVDAYRIGLEVIPDLMTPYRILQRDRFSLRAARHNADSMGVADEVILQERVDHLLIDAIRLALARRDTARARELIVRAVSFHPMLWAHGAADLDSGLNVFENQEVTDQDTIRLVDAGCLGTEEQKVRDHVLNCGRQAVAIQEMLASGKTLTRVVEDLLVGGYREEWSLACLLAGIRSKLTPAEFDFVGQTFLQEVAATFQIENLERVWKRDLS